MMIRVPPKDASILARVAQYTSLPPEQRQAILDQVISQEAREIGEVLLGTKTTAIPEIQEAADALKHWVQANRKMGPQKTSRPTVTSAS